MNKIQSQSTSNPSSIAQKAALAALLGEQSFPVEMRDAFIPRLEFILNRLNGMSGVSCVRPSGAFYVFPNLSSFYGKKSPAGKEIAGSVDLADYLLEEALLATVPGVAFGADDFIRFSFATSMQVLSQGMDRLEEALSRLS